jgi:AraC-like DNA-binding protein
MRRRPVAGNKNVDLLEQLLGGVNCSVLSAGWYRFPADWGFQDRVRSNAIIYVFVGGRAELIMGGVKRWLTVGDILLTAPDRSHSLSNNPNDPAEFYTTHFSAQVYGTLDLVALYAFPSLFRPGADRFEAILGAAQRIVSEFDAADPGYALLANAECAGALALLWRETALLGAQASAATHAGVPELARLAPVFRAIEVRYSEPLTLRELAATVHLNPTYFSAVFKRATGLSPFRYLAAYRLREVRHLLLSTDDSVRQIAVATGFRDPFYLSRVFKSAEGMSPRTYRLTQKNPGLP